MRWRGTLPPMSSQRIGPSETERVRRKYRNSKKYLRSLYPQLADVVEGEYGPILQNKPEIKRKLREMNWHLK